jgi:hypothetical protein
VTAQNFENQSLKPFDFEFYVEKYAPMIPTDHVL